MSGADYKSYKQIICSFMRKISTHPFKQSALYFHGDFVII